MRAGCSNYHRKHPLKASCYDCIFFFLVKRGEGALFISKITIAGHFACPNVSDVSEGTVLSVCRSTCNACMTCFEETRGMKDIHVSVLLPCEVLVLCGTVRPPFSQRTRNICEVIIFKFTGIFKDSLFQIASFQSLSCIIHGGGHYFHEKSMHIFN